MTPQNAKWDKLQATLGASFLQSALWADFQSSIGRQPYYLSGDGWSCMLVERQAALGRYMFAPYGPTANDTLALRAAVKDIKTFCQRKKVDWFRVEPIIKTGSADECHAILRRIDAKKAPSEVEPYLTRVVDLKPPPDDILATLSQTTRNLIRRNQRQKVITFKTSRDPADIRLFTAMLDTVAQRKGVGFYSADYYQKQAEILMPTGMMSLEIAYDDKRPVGTAIIHEYHQTATYTYAASDPAARDKNVSGLLLWQVMMNAKQRGNTQIDLYGIAPDEAPASHPWQGFSAFKKKFGGQVVEHAGTWDIPVSGRYRLYRMAVRAKKLAKRR